MEILNLATTPMTDREIAEKALEHAFDDTGLTVQNVEQAITKARLEARVEALEWANNSVYKEFSYELNSIYNELAQAKAALSKIND